MGTPHQAQIQVRNDTGDVADITISHHYDGAANAEMVTWHQVASGATTAPPLTVHYETGVGTGTDQWFASVTVGVKGAGERRSLFSSRGSVKVPGKYCMLQDSDNDGTHLFAVSTGRFDINLKSGACRAGMYTKGTVTDTVTNVFLLMLENRSFDHVFGWYVPTPGQGQPHVEGLVTTMSNLNGQTPVLVRQATTDAPASADPGHEFSDTYLQLTGTAAPLPPPKVTGPMASYPQPTNTGFVASYAQHLAGWSHPAPVSVDDAHLGEIMSGVAPQRNLVIHQLARSFALCDHWFSSMPGPTWPNRFFALGGSSAGLDDSQSHLNAVTSTSFAPYKFPGGTIFSKLADYGCTTRIYQDTSNLYGDPSKAGTFPLGKIPISASMEGVHKTSVRAIEGLAADLTDSYPYQFTFIEPHYGNVKDDTYVGGSSQHPTDTMGAGEALIAAVYKAIRNSPIWETSVLIVTYDEHGGYYDHVPPPTATPPGDYLLGGKYGFTFDRLGVRVPTVIVSPRVVANTVSSTVYDHTSVIRSVLQLFCGDKTVHLTNRDRDAADFLNLLSGPVRQTPPELLVGTPAPPTPPVAPPPANAPFPTSGNFVGFLSSLAQTDSALTDGSDAALLAVANRVAALRTYDDVAAYAADVFARDDKAAADRALVDGALSGLDPASLTALAVVLGIQPADLAKACNDLIAQTVALQLRDNDLSYEESRFIIRSIAAHELLGHPLTDLDGTPFHLPAWTAANAAALLNLPV